MLRQRSLTIRTALVTGWTVGLLPVGAGLASATPVVDFYAGATIGAHVTGAGPGHRCQIAARDIDGPWQPVRADGRVDLESGPVPVGRHTVRVLCEDRARGDAATHIVGDKIDVVTG